MFLYIYFQVFDIGPEGGDQEIDGDVLIETDEIPYECGARFVLVSELFMNFILSFIYQSSLNDHSLNK